MLSRAAGYGYVISYSYLAKCPCLMLPNSFFSSNRDLDCEDEIDVSSRQDYHRN